MFSNPASACYAMHKQSIEDFIEMLSKTKDPNDEETQLLCAEACNLNWDLLDKNEIEYIEREVSRRW